MSSGKLLFRKIIYNFWLVAAIKKTVAVILLLSFCFALNASAAQLIIEDAWIKVAPPGATSHAAYLRAINNNKKTITIKHISAVGYAHVMLHQTKIVKDKVQMDHVESLEISAGASVALTPGTIHLMLMQPLHPQKIDDQVKITLKFDDGTEQQFIALVHANHE